MSVIEGIQEEKVVAVIRKANSDNIVSILEALAKGGIHHVEITAETPNVENVIKTAVQNVNEEIQIGAGTVLDPETARALILAGATFIVSPTLNIKTLEICQRYGVEHIPGVFTPTEVLTAYEHGARMVKIFPIDAVGPNYVKNIRGPLPYVKAMVTGGITLDNIGDYLKAGSVAVGTGSSLVNAPLLQTKEDYAELTERAKQYIQSANQV